MSKWLSSYDPNKKTKESKSFWLSGLNSTIDGFIAHPLTNACVIIDAPEWIRWKDGRDLTYKQLADFVKSHKIRILNYGITADGRLAINFKTRNEATQFKLLWNGWKEDD